MTVRAALLAVVLLAFNLLWVAYAELTQHSWPTNAVPFFNVIFTLFFLTLGNLAVKRRLPRRALSQPEMLFLYIVLSIGTALGSYHFAQSLAAAMTYPYAFASPGNNWRQTLLPFLPKWLTVSDPGALAGYLSGRTSFFSAAVLRVWAGPLLMWVGFILALLAAMLAINWILREQWIRAERLSFPIVELPLQMIASPERLLRNRMLWIGFALAGGLDLWNGLAYLTPALPLINVKRHNIAGLFRTPPWNALGETNLSFYPFAIGLSFAMPLEVSVSCWLFMLLHKSQFVVGSLLGLTRQTGFPYVGEQQFGACLAIFAASLWTARGHLRRALRPESGCRPAVFALAGSVGFLLVFLSAAGMSPLLAAAFLAPYFVIAVVTTRIRAELGFPVHDMYRLGPPYILDSITGGRGLGPRTLALFGLFHWFNRQVSNHPMPHQLEGYAMAHRTGRPASLATNAAIFGGVVGAPMALGAALFTIYRLGAEYTRNGLAAGRGIYVEALPTWAARAAEPGSGYVPQAVMVAALLFTLLMYAMRMQFAWWPLHPIGYAVANSWGGITDIWTCVLIASAIKAALLRYGGLRVYRWALPFFLGLVLGEFIVGSAWQLWAAATNTSAYVFWL